MDKAHTASSNDHRIFYAAQPNVDVMKIRFSDRRLANIPADARAEFLARVCVAYNAFDTIDDAVEMRNHALDIIRGAQSASVSDGPDAAVEILRNAQI